MLACRADHVAAQDELVMRQKSPAKAFGLSLVVPGMGHRYVNDGRWGGAGSVFVTADITLWVGLAATILQEDHFVDGYSNLVALRAGNTLDGKNRAFELALGSYESSDEYLDALLRSRQWDRIESAQDPANRWSWESSVDRDRYVELRNDADEAGRRKTALIGALVVNRLISGITAALGARNKQSSGPSVSGGLGYHRLSNLPVASAQIRF